MTSEERMAQLIAEKDHTIGVLISVVEDYRSRLEAAQAEAQHEKTLHRTWWELYRDLKEGGSDE